MRPLQILIGTLAVLGLQCLCVAEDAQSLQQENTQLRQRIEKLEKAVEDLQRTPAAPSQPGRPADATAAAKPAESKPATPAPTTPAPATTKKSVLSNLDIELYGLIKADASFDSARTNPGNYVLFVDPQTQGHDNEFNLTANHTRLGMNITGPASDTLESAGKVEIDFFGNYAAENKAKIQMRHAYMTLFWPESHLGLLAGQTSDVFSPLNPNTLNYTVLWGAGNIAYRRPQVRLTEDWRAAEKVTFKFEEAIARTIGRTDPTGSESGEDAGFPTVQGRASVKLPFYGPAPAVIGVSGHYGQEEYDLNTTGSRVRFHSWSINLDVTQPIFKWLMIQGELFTGQDLDAYFGGIAQGVNTTTREEIASQGGWIAASLGPWSKFNFNVGAGIDDPKDGDVPTGGRTSNSSIFGNVIYSWNQRAQIGLEVSRWDTRYNGLPDGDDLRIQTSFMYSF
jgi:hypothetical protein